MFSLVFDERLAAESHGRCVRRLEGASPELARVNETCRTAVRAHLVGGRHINSIEHTHIVAETAAEIALEERLPLPAALMLLTAAWWHDAGNDGEPPGESRIRKEDVDANPALRSAAIRQRVRHAERSAQLADAFMREHPSIYGEAERAAVRSACLNHDNPTLAEYSDEPAKYLFGPDKGDWLPWLLREADRCYMLLARGGVLADLVRNAQRGKGWNAQTQITKNATRHHEERLLYERFCQPRLADYHFGATTAFYRSGTGQRLFEQRQRQSREISDSEWRQWVKEATDGLTS
jgi:hypothetical protein